MPHLLYAAPHSLYSAKARCYLRKQGIAYREVMPTDARFEQYIVPRIGRGIIPVLETVEGQIIQDTVDIIDHFEAAGVRYPAYPAGPRQRVLALMIEYYASLPLLRPAMHYRWSFFAEQERFVRDAFVAGSGAQAAEKIMGRMASYLPALGVSEALSMRESRNWRFLPGQGVNRFAEVLSAAAIDAHLRTDAARTPYRAPRGFQAALASRASHIASIIRANARSLASLPA